MQYVGLFGLIGLIGLLAVARPVPADRPGAKVRLLGLIGLFGFGGFCNPLLGAAGAFGPFGLWNHPDPRLARLAWFGLAGPIGVLTGLVLRHAGV